MKSMLAAVALVALASSAASAQDPAPAGEAGLAPEKKICRSEKMTGSLTRVRRICLTAKEWDELRLRSKHSLEDTQREAAGGKECVQDSQGGC